MEATQNALQLWPSEITGRQCTHPMWLADGTVELVSGSPVLVLTPGTPGGTWATQPRPLSLPLGTASTLMTFSVSQGHFLVLNNGVDPIEIVKVQSADGIYCYLEASPSAAYGPGSICNIVDPIGYFPVRGMAVKNVGAGNGSYKTAFAQSRAIYVGESIPLGSPYTLNDPVILDGTGTVLTLDLVAR